jgi:ketosteroid isomerase-like protein
MSDYAGTVCQIQEALERGDILSPMAHLTKDVRWAVNTADRDAAPWFGEYRGRLGVAAFFEAFSVVTTTDFEVKTVMQDGDRVVVLLHIGFDSPKQRHVDMDEAQVWQFRDDGKVQSVDLFPDTLAIAAAFA